MDPTIVIEGSKKLDNKIVATRVRSEASEEFPPDKKLGVLSLLTLVRRDESTFSTLRPFSKLENQFRCFVVSALMFGLGVESEVDFSRLSVSESTDGFGMDPLMLELVFRLPFDVRTSLLAFVKF